MKKVLLLATIMTVLAGSLAYAEDTPFIPKHLTDPNTPAPASSNSYYPFIPSTGSQATEPKKTAEEIKAETEAQQELIKKNNRRNTINKFIDILSE